MLTTHSLIFGLLPQIQSCSRIEMLLWFFAGICSCAFHKQILLCTTLQFISCKPFGAVKFDCLKVCGKWQHEGATEMNQFIQSVRGVFVEFSVSYSLTLSWRYLLHLCPKGVMRLNLIKAWEVLWRGEEVSVVCCYFILMCLWASVFYLGSGIEELRKFVLCISRSEGVVYFHYNKYFEAII